MTAASDRPRYSVVVPFFNEEANAPSLVAEIEAAMDALGEPWELLMVDDGSRDGTESLLAAAAALLTSSVFSGAAAGALSFEADGSVRVGAPWSASIFSELVLRPFADQDENVVSFALEWALVRGLLLQAGAGDRYQWLDASWETRF